MSLSSFDAVIFDLDGTLLDTIEDIADAVNDVLRARGFPAHDLETYKIIVGSGVEDMMGQALPEGHRDVGTIQATADELREQYRRHGLNKTHPYKGVKELLTELGRRGVKMSVLTNKPHDNAAQQIAYYLGNNHFVCIEGAKPHAPHKPDPTVALVIANRMGVAPARCAFLGDSDIDMRTAVNAGMYALGALWGFRTAEELVANGASDLLAKPLDLLTLF
jgi:phosphoglycolate phosphatase